MNQRQYLLQLISEGEHQQQDFKYKVADAVKLAKSVSAFANTDGGRLLIGVRDDGHLSGVRSEEEIFMMRAAAESYCRPAVNISFDTITTEGRTIVVATVYPSCEKPIRALCDDGKWRAYIRIADENIVASVVHLHIWQDELSPKGQLVNIGDEESKVMRLMNTHSQLPLNQIAKLSGVSRHRTAKILAQLVRYNLAECRFSGSRFVFSAL